VVLRATGRNQWEPLPDRANEPIDDPLPGALVFASPGQKPDSLDRYPRRASTDLAGEARLELEPGDWHVRVMGGLSSTGQEADVLVEPGGTHDLVLLAGMITVAEGAVVDNDGMPVPAAEIWLGRDLMGSISPPDVIVRRGGVSDAAGRFRVFAGLLDRVAARKDGYAASRTQETLQPGGRASGLRLVLGRDPAAVPGTVVDARGRPIDGAVVTLQPAQPRQQRDADGTLLGPPLPLVLHTDGNGRFMATGMAPGTYRCEAQARPYLVARASVELAPFLRAEVRLVLGDGVAVRGTVRRRGGEPASGLRVQVVDAAARVLGSATTGADGRYGLPRVPVRDFRVRALRGERVVAEHSFAPPFADEVACDFVLDEPRSELRSVRGIVVDPGDRPLAGWFVEARSSATQDIGCTDGRGGFDFFGLGVGPFRLAAWAERGDPERPAVVEEQVAAGTDALRLVVPMDALPTGRLSGRVVDAGGVPLPDVRVTLLGRRSAAKPEVDGAKFRGEGLVPGDYRLHLCASGCAFRSSTCTVSAQVPLDLGDVVLGPAARLRVRVLLADGSPWPVAGRSQLLPIVRTEGGAPVEPLPDCRPDGDALAVDGLSTGRYQLTVRDDDLVAEPLRVEVRAGGTTEVDWRVAIGRRRLLVFAGDPGVPADAKDAVHVVVRDATGREVLARAFARDPDPPPGGVQVGRRVGLERPDWVLAHTFVPGRYEVDARTDSGRRYHTTLTVREDLGDAERIEVTRVR
jgi:hypothetical protein